MALYRFLFAPVLLAIAVLIGSRAREATPSQPAPPAAAGQRASIGPPPPLTPAGERAIRAAPAPVH